MIAKSDHYPIGAVLLFAGILPENKNWLLCDGRQFNISEYPELFDTIGYTYGGEEEDKVFQIPNYSGQFLRGAPRESNADPDKHLRQSLHPNLENDPEKVGTIQGYGTKIPNGDPFKAEFKHLPKSSKKTHGITKGDNTGYDGSASKTQDTCTSGGDKESRPINIYLNMYIKSRTN